MHALKLCKNASMISVSLPVYRYFRRYILMVLSLYPCSPMSSNDPSTSDAGMSRGNGPVVTFHFPLSLSIVQFGLTTI